MKWWKAFGLVLWVVSIFTAIWASKRLGMWNLDVFFVGLSAGVLVSCLRQ